MDALAVLRAPAAVLAAPSLLLFMALPARAEGRLQSLGLEDAVRLALQHSVDSRGAEEDVRSARGALAQARVLPNPSLFVSSLDRGLSPVEAAAPNQFGVTWTLPIGGKRAAGIDAASAAVDAAQATRIAARRQVAHSVETAFIAVLLDQAQLAFADEAQLGIHKALELNELRYKDGKIAYGDVLKIRIQSRTGDDTVRQDELTLANDRAELARLVGEGILADDFKLVGNLAVPALRGDELTAEQVLDRALKNRTDYLALLAQERSGQGALRQARRQPIPDLGILFDYNRIPGEAGSYDVQLSAAIPLFDRNSGSVTQADAALRKARLASEGMRVQIRADAYKAVKAWETSRARLKVYDQELLSAATESLDISRHAYEEGRGTLLDYLDAESSYRDVESAYRSAVADAMNAAVSLRFAAGEDLP